MKQDSDDKDKETRYIYCQTVWDALCGHVFHLPVCADDAILMAIYR